MAPIGPLSGRRLPETLRRQVDVAGAAAWEALVEVHARHALRFITLLSERYDFDVATDRYLDELDVRDPMASAVRSRVLIDLERALREAPPPPPPPSEDEAGEDDAETAQGLSRLRPDKLVKDLARLVRETGTPDERVRLAVARAEEAVIRSHVDNAVTYARLLRDHAVLNDAVDDYLELMRVTGGRGQSVHQRAMARLAEIYLPDREDDPDGSAGTPDTRTGGPDARGAGTGGGARG